MEGTMSEIRCFSGNFAPKTWAFCQGQLLAISTNQALFALLGTFYGGNGTTNFALPDLRSRIPVGTGTSNYGSTYTIGQIGGEETHTLVLAEMPAHNHVVTVTPATGAGAISCTLNGTTNAATTTSNNQGYFANDNGNVPPALYATSASSPTLVDLNAGSVSVSNVTMGTPTLTISNTGSNQAHSNIQPVLGMNYIICLQGVFPSRN